MATRSGLGIGRARPPDTKATCTVASTKHLAAALDPLMQHDRRALHLRGAVTISSTSSMRAGLRKSICIERTTKAKPGASFSTSSNSAR